MQIKAMVALPVVLAGAAALAPQASANPYSGMDSAHVQYFSSPSDDIHCEIDFQRGYVNPTHPEWGVIPDAVYCTSVNPLQKVQIRPDGSLASVCANDPSCGSNGQHDEEVLAYGQSAVLGPFTCYSEESGMTCTADGRGFKISTPGIVTV